MIQGIEQLGPYRVVRFLGAGAAGTVYEAVHTAMGTRHALKVLGEQYRQNPAVRERLRREAQLMFELGRHPHIVRATDVLEDEELMALVMDYVDGGDLGQALAERPGGLPWAEAWRILGPIVSAVACAHRRGVVHRDLKPENVLLRRDGTWPGTPLVADFGIARDLGADSATRTQSRMGTPGYGAPEQFRSARQAGTQADVWALGMLAWRLVNGRLPVDPHDNLALIRLHEGLSSIPPLADVPEHVSRAVSAALTLDPARRPRDAGALERLLSDGEASLDAASVDGPRDAVASVAAPGAGSSGFAPVSASPPPSGLARPRSSRGLLLGVGGALLLVFIAALADGRRTDAEVWVEGMHLLADNKNDCDRLVRRFRPFVDDHAETLRRANKRIAESDAAFAKELGEASRDTESLVEAAGEAMARCLFHDDFAQLLQKVLFEASD
jgi:serine/threonine protein kinase